MTNLFNFMGGEKGVWKIEIIKPIIGETIPNAARLEIIEGKIEHPAHHWILRGVTSFERYVTTNEKKALKAIQPPLNRPEAICAALIPIKKMPAWWELAPDERRRIFEAQSKHIEIGMKYLPAVARKLFHCREIGEHFDFLTWFEFAPEHAEAFEELLVFLRNSEEWTYVEREVDIRLSR